LHNRRNTYQLSHFDEKKEKNIIQQIITNNKYDPPVLDKIKLKKKQTKQDTEKYKWAKFTYIGRETLFITKIFKDSNIKVTFSTDNTIEKLLTTQQKQSTKIRQIRYLSVKMPYMQYEVHRTNWKTI